MDAAQLQVLLYSGAAFFASFGGMAFLSSRGVSLNALLDRLSPDPKPDGPNLPPFTPTPPLPADLTPDKPSIATAYAALETLRLWGVGRTESYFDGIDLVEDNFLSKEASQRPAPAQEPSPPA